MHTTTIPLTRHWKLIAKEKCQIQFNDLTRVAFTSGFVPKESTGFEYQPGSTIIHDGESCLWARIKKPTSGIRSLRITESGRQ